MLDNLLRIAGAGAAITAHEANKLHAEIIKWLINTFILTLFMWGFNVVGLMGLNFFILFLGSIIIFAKAIKPINVLLAATAGAGINGLLDKDKTQGAVAGMIFLSRIFIGVMLGFFLIGGILATYSFKEAPMMFFPIAVMLILIGLTIEYYQIKGKILPWLIIGYATVIIFNSIWYTVPEKKRNDLSNYIPFSSTEKKADMDFPEIELNQNGKNNGVTVPMNFTTQVKVKISIPLTKVGISYGVCGKVVEPMKILDLADTPRVHTEADDPEKRGVSHFMHLTREMKKHMLNHNYKEARVNFYLVEKHSEDPIVCN